MRKDVLTVFVPLVLAVASGSVGHAQGAQHVRRSEVGGRLAPADQQYASIAGVRLKGYVEELAQISRRYRDNGHPQFWGRIIGTAADAENAQWMLQKFRALGMTDVREQVIDLSPQWMPQSWSVTASAVGKTLAPRDRPAHLWSHRHAMPAASISKRSMSASAATPTSRCRETCAARRSSSTAPT